MRAYKGTKAASKSIFNRKDRDRETVKGKIMDQLWREIEYWLLP